MIKEKGLLDLDEGSSLVRTVFDKTINLNEFNFPSISIPSGFKNFSFIPGKNGLNIIDCVDKLKLYLQKEKISDSKHDHIIPGVIEAIKNAYVHGNKRNNDKRIFWHQKVEKNNTLEVLIGDQGGEINGNLFAYALKIKDEKFNNLNLFPDYYSFCGKNYAPLDHSGVGTINMNKCFEKVRYFKNKDGGLTVYLGKKLNQ